MANPTKTAKERYPLEIKNVGGDTYIVMSRGHHEPHEFMRKVREVYDWPLGFPQHVWIKATPTPEGCQYNVTSEGTRGAFPATYAWERYAEDRYEAIVAAAQSIDAAEGKKG